MFGIPLCANISLKKIHHRYNSLLRIRQYEIALKRFFYKHPRRVHMASDIQTKLDELGIKLDSPAVPAGNYVPVLVIHDMVYISGQLPLIKGAIEVTGQVGSSVSIKDAQEQARQCAVAILRQVSTVSDNLKQVKRVVKLGGFVTSAPEFTEQPKVIDAASELMVALFADNGKHTRFAVGVSALPLGAVVEIDAIFQLKS
jgi:enamine deaminase RidA (YjgF/YER057c/UK114 family)